MNDLAKLTAAQRRVVELMRNGWKLRSQEGIDGPRPWLSKGGPLTVEKIATGTLYALSDRGIIVKPKRTYPISKWILTDAWKADAEDASEPMRLFVYGTLKHGREPARIRGDIFDLGSFPGVVRAGDPEASIVIGEVMDVDAAKLEGFDRIEGVAAGLYRRLKVHVLDDDDEPTGEEVFVYEYARSIRDHKRIESGEWLGERAPWTPR